MPLPGIENLDNENAPGYEKRGEPDKGNVVAIDAAESERLPVVGLGDEKPRLPGKAEVVVINSAAQNDSLPLDAKGKKMTRIPDTPAKDPTGIADTPAKGTTGAPLPFTAIPGAELDSFIRARAYELYEQGCRQDGHADEHWRQAQSEILSLSGTTEVRNCRDDNAK